MQRARPPGWPLASSRVFVLPSPSGRAAMTVEQRRTPYEALGLELDKIEWRAGTEHASHRRISDEVSGT